jgi:ligand-binding sensor domain-containing protein
MLTRILISVFCFATPWNLVFGQKLEFAHFYTEDGLSQSTVSAIEQDYQGFMWIGTFNGLNRFDGYSFKVYKTDPEDSKTLTSSHIEAIFEDSKKNLWIGAADGVNLYNRKLDAFDYYRYDDPVPSQYAVNTFAEGKDGKVWVGGWQGLSYVDTVSKKVISFNLQDGSFNDGPKAIFDLEVESSSGNLWLATDKGLYYYDFQSRSTRKVTTANSLEPGEVENEIKSLFTDRNGSLWVGTQRGLYTIRKNENILIPIPGLKNQLVHDINQNTDDVILIGTENGLFAYHDQTGTLDLFKKGRSANTISDNVVKRIFKDHDNHLWLGTYYGLNYNGRFQNFRFLGKATLEQPGLKNPFVTSLCSINEKQIFIGTAEGIEVIELVNGGIQNITQKYSGIADIVAPVLWMSSDNIENMIISVWPKKAYRYNWKTNQLRPIAPPDQSACGFSVIDDEGDAWTVCGNMLYKYDLKSGQFEKVASFVEYSLTFLKRDREKKLLFGTASGILKYDLETNEQINIESGKHGSASLDGVVVNCIHVDHSKNLWMATSQGLFKLTNSGELISFWKKLGFGDDDMKSIIEDSNNNLWISATNVLYRFNKNDSSLRKFEIPDGVLVKEFSEHASIRLQSGAMAFGGKQGLVVFQPDSIKNNIPPPPVVITDFKVLNKPVAAGSKVLPQHISVSQKIELDYTAKEFSFEFVALNFASASKNQYAYMMEGFDKEWNYAGTRRFASYTNLPAGKEYVFKVKASNGENNWNNQGISLKIYIRPPFWETWWFKLVAYSVATLLVYLVYRLRVNTIRRQRIQLQKQKVLLQEEVRARTADLLEANQQLQLQAQEIAHMNALLQQDNIKLEHDVKDLVEARVMQKHVTFDEFQRIYPDSEACYKFIDDLKSGKEFHCKKCNYHKFSKNPDYSRRCSKCNYVETIITGTIFAGIKFPITKAFYLLFLMSEGKHYTIGELSELVELRQQTCWTFKKRVEERRSNLKLPKNKDGWSQVIMLPDLAHQKS